MLRAVALRLESGAMTWISIPSSSAEGPAQRAQALGPDAVVVGDQDSHAVSMRGFSPRNGWRGLGIRF